MCDYRDDMGDTYGAGYMTRSADEGYGERYGEAVKKVMDNKADKEGPMQELQSGTTADRDQNADAGTATNLLPAAHICSTRFFSLSVSFSSIRKLFDITLFRLLQRCIVSMIARKGIPSRRRKIIVMPRPRAHFED